MNPETAVRNLYQQLIEGWNARDATTMAEALGVEGLVIGFDGSQMVGREAAAAELGDIFADHQPARYVTKARRVEALGADAAMLYAVAGMVPPGGEHIVSDLNAVQTVVVQRAGDEWKVALFQTTPAQLHGRPELRDELTGELEALLPPE